MIYLDYAATSYRKPKAVVEAVAYAMEHMGNSGRGAHGASLDASRVIYETRELLAELFSAGDASHVAFTANSTESLNLAISGAFTPGDHVITTMMEHNSVLRPLYRLEESGVELTIIRADRKGVIRYEDFEAAIRENTKGIVCTHASNLTGNLVEIGRVGGICRKHGLLFIVDASQTAGVLPIDMDGMGIDVLCFTGHKSLMGPQGIGGLCVREGVVLRPLLVGGSGVHSYSKVHPSVMPAALEAGTLNGHGIAGLRASLLYIKEIGMETIRNREMELLRQLYKGMRDIPKVTVYGDFSCMEAGKTDLKGAGRGCETDGPFPFRAPIVALNIRGYDSGEAADELAVSYDICTRAGAHCAPLMHQALGTAGQGAVRFSLSHFTTEDEIDAAIRAVRELADE